MNYCSVTPLIDHCVHTELYKQVNANAGCSDDTLFMYYVLGEYVSGIHNAFDTSTMYKHRQPQKPKQTKSTKVKDQEALRIKRRQERIRSGKR